MALIIIIIIIITELVAGSVTAGELLKLCTQKHACTFISCCVLHGQIFKDRKKYKQLQRKEHSTCF